MLTVKPISLKDANDYIIENHRHHDKVSGHKFSISVYDGDRLCGVATVGRPLSRLLDNGNTLEVTRLCTDGTRNACSILYARCARIANTDRHFWRVDGIVKQKTVVGGVGLLLPGQGNW